MNELNQEGRAMYDSNPVRVSAGKLRSLDMVALLVAAIVTLAPLAATSMFSH
jgi:hypothetical protein